MNAADVINAPTDRAEPHTGLPVDVTRRGGRLKIFARDGGSRFRIIADDTQVRDAELVEVAFFDHQEEATAIASACADILGRSAVMAADQYGWHALPPGARLEAVLPTLLATARTDVRARPEPAPAEDVEIEPAAALAPLPPQVMRQGWTLRRVAWFGFLVGLGWTAKRIAADELIRSTPENVWRQAHRFGLSLAAAPQGQVCVDLPLATLVAIDKAAAAAHLQRDVFVKRLLIRAAKDGYGMVAVTG